MRKESLPFNNYNMVKVCDAGNNQKAYVVYRIKVINVDNVPEHRFLELQCNCLTYNSESKLTLEDFIQKNEDRFTTVTKGRNFNEVYQNAFGKKETGGKCNPQKSDADVQVVYADRGNAAGYRDLFRAE